MSAASHQPATTTHNPTGVPPVPPATRQDAGGVQNTLGLPLTVIDGWPVFDCRTSDEEAGTVKAPWGEMLWGSERAAYSLGLRTSYMGDDTTPLSLSGCPDLRRWPAEFERVAKDLVRGAKRLMKDYEGALANPAGADEGGSVFYRPVAVAVCNFGGSVIADRGARAVRRFS